MTKKTTKKAEKKVTSFKKAADLKAFLQSVRDDMSAGSLAPIYAMTTINQVMNLENVYTLLTAENKEIARDIWLRLESAGIAVKAPNMLFEG
jgi:hypothetical protein